MSELSTDDKLVDINWNNSHQQRTSLSISDIYIYYIYMNDFMLYMGWYLPVNWCGIHDDVIKWKYFPRYWPFVRGIHRSPVNSPHKGQWRGALMFSLICVWINGWVNNGEAGDLRRYRIHYDVIVMYLKLFHGKCFEKICCLLLPSRISYSDIQVKGQSCQIGM